MQEFRLYVVIWRRMLASQAVSLLRTLPSPSVGGKTILGRPIKLLYPLSSNSEAPRPYVFTPRRQQASTESRIDSIDQATGPGRDMLLFNTSSPSQIESLNPLNSPAPDSTFKPYHLAEKLRK